ncbi:hypothetical protein BJ322DRAFT_510417 [Thelephora terrestris]|uniref:Uncharacterized protein n=1 Tax=Thelephora terrestris TaxID=56493 RepID=A0A9P6L1A1_9AGAM|nr:hypothetical protein BJ322DRAFT_510417 [Thelephora terrestris]
MSTSTQPRAQTTRMPGDLVSTSFDDLSPTQWLNYLCGLEPVAPEQMTFPDDTFEAALFPASLDHSYLCEPLPVETQPEVQPTDVDKSATVCVVHPSSVSLSPLPSLPSPQPLMFQPPKWHEIPQTPHNRGRTQRGHTPSEPILFQVSGYPGVNVGDALRDTFTGLENGNDLIILGSKKTAFSCRFSFPGYPRNESPQIFTTYWNKEHDPIPCSVLAHRVARKLKGYLDEMNDLPMDSSIDRKWKVGEGFMQLNNMYLAKLEPTSRGSFQPQVWVVDPTV